MKHDKINSKEEALNTLKENICSGCPMDSSNMDACDISYCDNKDAIEYLETLQERLCFKIHKITRNRTRRND